MEEKIKTGTYENRKKAKRKGKDLVVTRDEGQGQTEKGEGFRSVWM